MPKNYKKKQRNKQKKNTTTGEPYDGRPPREQLTNIKVETRQSLWWKRTTMQLQWCILLYKKTLIQLILSPDED